MCELLRQTQHLALERGLDPSRITCQSEDSCEGCHCLYLEMSDPIIEDPVDMHQDSELKVLEGRQNVARFYGKLQEHTQKTNGHKPKS